MFTAFNGTFSIWLNQIPGAKLLRAKVMQHRSEFTPDCEAVITFIWTAMLHESRQSENRKVISLKERGLNRIQLTHKGDFKVSLLMLPARNSSESRIKISA